jgi:ribonuclease HI
MPPVAMDQEYWTVFFDGSVRKRGAWVRLVFVSPLEVRLKYVIPLHFTASNNIVEYMALVNDLHITM